MDKISEDLEDAARQHNSEIFFWYAEPSLGGGGN
jgi:hypothetical protein